LLETIATDTFTEHQRQCGRMSVLLAGNQHLS